MTKQTWTAKDVHFDETCFLFTPSIGKVSKQGLNLDEGSWLEIIFYNPMSLHQIL